MQQHGEREGGAVVCWWLEGDMLKTGGGGVLLIFCNCTGCILHSSSVVAHIDLRRRIIGVESARKYYSRAPSCRPLHN